MNSFNLSDLAKVSKTKILATARKLKQSDFIKFGKYQPALALLLIFICAFSFSDKDKLRGRASVENNINSVSNYSSADLAVPTDSITDDISLLMTDTMNRSGNFNAEKPELAETGLEDHKLSASALEQKDSSSGKRAKDSDFANSTEVLVDSAAEKVNGKNRQKNQDQGKSEKAEAQTVKSANSKNKDNKADKQEKQTKQPNTVKVNQGEGWWHLGVRTGVDYRYLAAFNGKRTTDPVYAGEVYKIPSSEEIANIELPKAETVEAEVSTDNSQLTVGNLNSSGYIGAVAQPGSSAYEAGWCAWYVYNARYAIGRALPSNLGNAESWAANASAAGYVVNNVPEVGAVVIPSYNHVAFVEGVYADGSILISEAGWGYQAYGYNKRVINGNGLTYIH